MRQLLSKVLEDFRTQDKGGKWLLSILVIGIIGHTASIIVLWLLT
jgi:hypothetical protein